MVDSYALVIGGGAAGVSAAITLAESGQNVLLIEQRDKLGGAVHRQPGPRGAHVLTSAGLSRQWRSLTTRFEAQQDRIKTSLSSVFIGIDGDGRFLFDRTSEKRTYACRPSVVVAALGASERVRPFKGWNLPGVMTAGAAQVLLKEMGTFPEGRILVAGSGPLLIALAAQLSRCGRAPLAVLESSRLQPSMSAICGLLRGAPQLREAVGYGLTLLRNRVRIRTGTQVRAARERTGGLNVDVQHGSSRTTIEVEYLLMHDGVFPMHVPSLTDTELKVPVILAGDGREILGAHAAALDGERAGREALAFLGQSLQPSQFGGLEKARQFQRALSLLFSSEPPPISGEAVICFCEQKRLSDLHEFGADASAREVRLVGRFGMGPCQGRFCQRTLQSFDRDFQISTSRWPIRPVSVGSLAALTEHDINFLEF